MKSLKLMGKRHLGNIDFIISFICIAYIIALAIYYGLQDQVDFRVFWTAGKEWNEGNNPYLKENQGNPAHPLLNAPTSLLLYGIIGAFDLKTAAVIYRIFCVGLLLILVFFICRKLNMPFYLVLPFIALSTPVRTNLGSGQVSLLATFALIYVVLSVYKDKQLNDIAIVFSLFIILTFKAYMLPAVILLLFLRRKKFLILLGLSAFATVTLILDTRINMIDSWLHNTSKIGAVAINEANNSSIVSIVSRLSNNINLGIIVFLFINVILVYILIKSREEILVMPGILILSLVSSIYVHHQDYLLALVALIIWLSHVSQKNSKIIDFFQIGLQPSSMLLHLVTFLLRVLQFNGDRPRNYSWYPLIFSGAAAFFWHKGNLDESFLIYDSIYMLISFLIIYRIRKSIITS